MLIVTYLPQNIEYSSIMMLLLCHAAKSITLSIFILKSKGHITNFNYWRFVMNDVKTIIPELIPILYRPTLMQKSYAE